MNKFKAFLEAIFLIPIFLFIEGIHFLVSLFDQRRTDKGNNITGRSNTSMFGQYNTSVSEQSNISMTEQTNTSRSEQSDTSMTEQTDTSMTEQTNTPMSEQTNTPMSEQTNTPMSEQSDTSMSVQPNISMADSFFTTDNNNIVVEVENYYKRLVERLMASEKKLEKKYPGIFDQIAENKTKNLVSKLFPLGLPKNIYVSCFPETANSRNPENITYRFRVIRTPNDYLSRFMPANRTLTFNANFNDRICGIRIQDVFETLARPCCINEIGITITPQDYSSRRDVSQEFLTDIQTRAIEKRNNIDAHLNLWREYLDWLEALCFSQIKGFRYIDYTIDKESKQILFRVLFENEYKANNSISYFRNKKKSIVATDLNISTSPYEFKYNHGVRRNDVNLGRFADWEKEGFVTIAGRDFYLAVVKFYRGNGSDLPNKEGFLTENLVGEFNLINIQRTATERLLAGNSNSAELLDWLFNPNTVSFSENIRPVTITSWKNKNIENNENQKQAVEKMLAAPSLFLLQGPPGTGKTTVIAEAIYQFGKMGKTVFLTSQSNDAVDNALERLALDTAVRAIRIEKLRNINDDESASRESADSIALRRFYESWAKGIQGEWLQKWADLDAELDSDRKNLRDAELAIKDSESISKKAEKLYWQKVEAEEVKNSAAQKLNDLKVSESNHMSNIINTDIYSKCISGDFSNEFVFDEKTNNLIFSKFSQILESSLENGIQMLPKDCINSYSAIDNEEKSSILNRLVKNFSNLGKLIDNLSNNTQNADSVEAEAKLLEEKRELGILIEKYLTDGESIPEEMQNKYRSIGHELTNLKNSSGIRFSESDKSLLSDKLLKDFDVKIVLPVLIRIRDEFAKAFNDSVSCLKEELKKNKQQEINDINEAFKNAEGHMNEITKEFNEAKAEYEALTAKISGISKQYFKKTKTDNEQLLKVIKAKIENNQAKQNDSSYVRKVWENTLSDLVNRLNSITNSSKSLDSDELIEKYKSICNVVGMTCTGSTKSLYNSEFTDFDVVIVDEVSKATPTELLIPLLLGRKVILVGDHRQLPPMFKEQERSYMELIDNVSEMPENMQELLIPENFEKFKKIVTSSVFKTLFENAPEAIKHTLLTQYRMHSDIMGLINNFYENRLICGINSDKRNHGITLVDKYGNNFIRPDQHAYWINSHYGFDGKRAYEKFPVGGTSAYNPLEVVMTVRLLIKIAEDCKTKGIKKTIGVVSFYQKQINEIRNNWRTISASYRQYIDVDINTVDRFQGKEKNIIIASLVRNNPKGKPSEHIVAYERINVAFSRAQELLVIIGSEHFYCNANVKLPKMDTTGVETVKVYYTIIRELKNRNCFFNRDSLDE